MWECVWEVGAEEWMVVGTGNLLGGRLSTILNSGPAGLCALTSFYRPFDQALPHKTHTHIHADSHKHTGHLENQ